MAEIELREVPLFSEMDEQEVAGIRSIMEELKFKPGQVIIRETAGEVTWAASEAFGDGHYSKRKLADFPGHELLTG